MIQKINFYLSTIGIRGLIGAIKGKVANSSILLEMNIPTIKFPFFLRLPSSDVATYPKTQAKSVKLGSM